MPNADPVYGYIDKQVKSLKVELLETQRFLAEMSARVNANECRDDIRNLKAKPSSFLEELTARFAVARKEIKESPKPLLVASSFARWCEDMQRKVGVRIIDLPS